MCVPEEVQQQLKPPVIVAVIYVELKGRESDILFSRMAVGLGDGKCVCV